MSKQGVGPTDDGRNQSKKYEEQLAFPQSTAPDDLAGALTRLQQLNTVDRKSQNVSLERIVLAVRALDEAETQYRLSERLDETGKEGPQAVLEALCDTSQRILSDLKARKRNVSADCAQLSAVLGDKLASIWARYFVATDAEPEVSSIAKNLYAIFDLGKLGNIDDLPQHIRQARHLSSLARFGLWGVSQAYFGILAGDTKLERYCQQVSMHAFNRADAARQLAEAPPHELALLKGGSQADKAQGAFQVASELLLNSVQAATAEARDQGIILRAQKVSEFVIPFIERLSVSQIRSWMTDYSMTCRQAHESNDFDIAQEMWKRLEELAHNAGDSVAVDALRFTARRIKSDMSLEDLGSARQAVETFRTKFAALHDKQEVAHEAMTVGQAAISLLLKEVESESFYEHAQSLLSDACTEVEALVSLVQSNPSIGPFMVVESALEVAGTYLERDDIEQSHDRALELWQRARALLDDMDERSIDEALYSRVSCRIVLAEVAAFFDDGDMQASQRDALQSLWAPLRTKLEFGDLQDYERKSYQFAQVNLLRTLATVECSLDQEASGAGVKTIKLALSLYHKYSVSDGDGYLLRTLYEVAIHVHEKNQLFSDAIQFRQKLERLG